MNSKIKSTQFNISIKNISSCLSVQKMRLYKYLMYAVVRCLMYKIDIYFFMTKIIECCYYTPFSRFHYVYTV